MRKTGAQLLRYALEQVGVRFTFGIPGVHTTELYDELNASEHITPILVTHEGGGAFMADAISRTTDTPGTLLVVPAAGLTHAASGIAEAFLDGIPMLVISGGIRTDSGHRYQLHDIDQSALMKPITKAQFRLLRHQDVVPTLFEAVRIAYDGEPGPVYVEMPLNIAAFAGEVEGELPVFRPAAAPSLPPEVLAQVSSAVELLKRAKRPGIFAGWGARFCEEQLTALAEQLNAPVSTTLQGLSVFPGNHPLFAGFSFGPHAVPAAAHAFQDCDCLIAIGTRFAEIPTGSYGLKVPENLIHIDINPAVFDANYPAKVKLPGDARLVVGALLDGLQVAGFRSTVDGSALQTQLKRDKLAYHDEWFGHDSGHRVNPARFFSHLRHVLADDAIVVADDGNHTFLTAELLPMHRSRHFLSPSDFNCMGYCVPATIGAKLAHPEKQVVGIVGDGAFLMTCMELVTAASNELGVVQFVFNDGELSQISQAQEIPYNRKVCSVLGVVDFAGVALATGCEYRLMAGNGDVGPVIDEAMKLAAQGKPVVVDVRVDYSKRTRFTKGIVATNLKRFDTRTQLRFVGRAVWRRVTG
ncbi:MAG: thiamine pyrophosphate-binding protein [Fluviicoccus sp.]|uniref:thiamine pyrophosphate-binding protein n=1 Tax=Fluviicoccus sp. TaxID=2003552 RepID=UPI00272002CB|nr:thiamine pyrophosphate-binding protein [Fluviicoccus sp.]MDO8330570.1 thiamine pyrophosphate-binding protein [Fluviicoccus sp.]